MRTLYHSVEVAVTTLLLVKILSAICFPTLVFIVLACVQVLVFLLW